MSSHSSHPDPATLPPECLPPECWVVDGLEETEHGPVARLERPDGSSVVVPLSELSVPGLSVSLREGDVLRLHDGPDGAQFLPDPQATARRRNEAQRQLAALNAAGETQEIVL